MRWLHMSSPSFLPCLLASLLQEILGDGDGGAADQLMVEDSISFQIALIPLSAIASAWDISAWATLEPRHDAPGPPCHGRGRKVKESGQGRVTLIETSLRISKNTNHYLHMQELARLRLRIHRYKNQLVSDGELSFSGIHQELAVEGSDCECNWESRDVEMCRAANRWAVTVVYKDGMILDGYHIRRTYVCHACKLTYNLTGINGRNKSRSIRLENNGRKSKVLQCEHLATREA